MSPKGAGSCRSRCLIGFLPGGFGDWDRRVTPGNVWPGGFAAWVHVTLGTTPRTFSPPPPPPPRGQFALYLYYLVVAYVLRAISPPLSQMASQEAALTGSFRAAHQV